MVVADLFPSIVNPSVDGAGLIRALRDAALDVGYSWAPDHNDPRSTGVSPFAMHIRDGQRVSSNHAWIDPPAIDQIWRSAATCTWIVSSSEAHELSVSLTRGANIDSHLAERWCSALERRILLRCCGAPESVHEKTCQRSAWTPLSMRPSESELKIMP